MKITRRLRVSGRVQGVGYREAMCAVAARLGVTGWVRNRVDGSVEAAAHADAKALEEFTAWARRGPPAARVTGIEISEDTGEFMVFERRPTG